MRSMLIVGLALAASGAFGQTLNDLWHGRAKLEVEREDDGKAKTFGFAGMHFLSFVENGNGWNVYYIDHSIINNNVGLATTKDGVVFEKVGVVMKRGTGFDSRIASFPGVFRDESGWYLVYEAADGGEDDPSTWKNRGSIGWATSHDGVTWTKQGELLAKKEVWERQNIGTPSLLRVDGVWWLFYHGFGPSGAGGHDDVQIGAAKGKELKPGGLTRVSEGPIIPTSADPGKFDSGTVGKRTMIKEGGWWYMVYEASTDQAGDPPGFNHAKWSSGIARSKDLVHWEKHPEPVLPQLGEFGFDGAEFLRTGDGKLHLYFRLPGNWTGRATLVKLKKS